MIIVLEGLDNCGKNTVANLLCKKYAEFHKVDFPNYETSFGQFIKTQLSKNTLPPISMQLLFSSERLSKAQEVLDLSQKGVVITTRYSYSARAYGIARGIGRDLLMLLEQDMPKADVKIFLKITPQVSQERSADMDAFERDLPLLQKVDQEYQKILSEEKDWHVIDATCTINEVLQKVEKVIDNYLPAR